MKACSFHCPESDSLLHREGPSPRFIQVTRTPMGDLLDGLCSLAEGVQRDMSAQHTVLALQSVAWDVFLHRGPHV
jgi:hypothetical protein